MGQIIAVAFEGRKCPVGTFAWHAQYGVCEVIASEGLRRQVMWMEPIAESDVPDNARLGDEEPGWEVVSEEFFASFEAWVDVRELRPADGGVGRCGGGAGQIWCPTPFRKGIV